MDDLETSAPEPSGIGIGRMNRRGVLAAAAMAPGLLGAGSALAAPSGPAPLGGFPGAAPADLDAAVDEFFSYLEPLKDAVQEVIHKTLDADDGGVIAVGSDGTVVMDYSTEGMARAAADSTGWREIKIGR